MACGISGLVYRRIDGNVDRKSTGQLTRTMYPRRFRGINRFAEDYHQQYLAKNPDGYCGLGGCGVTYKFPEIPASEKA